MNKRYLPVFLLPAILISTTVFAQQSPFSGLINDAHRIAHALQSPSHTTQQSGSPQMGHNEIPGLTKILWVYAPSGGYRFLASACSGIGSNSFQYMQAESDYQQGNYYGASANFLEYAGTVAECAVKPAAPFEHGTRTITPSQAYVIVGKALAKSFLADTKVTAGRLDAAEKIKATNAVKLLDDDPETNADLIRKIVATGVFGRPPVLPDPVPGSPGATGSQPRAIPEN